MRTEAQYVSHVGKVRTNNEDCLLLNDGVFSQANMRQAGRLVSSATVQIFAVADGMGGHQKGEVASRTVLEVLCNRYATIGDTHGLMDAMLSAKTALNWLVEKDRDSFGMGTTATGVLINGERCFLFHCGDSRLYRLAGRSLEKLTRDHSLVQDLFDEGVITEDEMRSHPRKNILSSALMGDRQEGLPMAEVREILPACQGTFLICSDGLWECVAKSEMEECLMSPTDEASCLFEKAMSAGARDNVSFIVLKISKG